MSGYQLGLLVIFSFNVIAAYAVYLPLAAGQLNLGIAGFMATGAYSAAYLTNEFGWPAVPAVLIGGLSAGVLALVVAAAILRTQGIYLALATFALGQVIVAVFLNMEVVGAAAGYPVQTYLGPWFVVGAALIVFVFVLLISQTRLALYLTAIKNDVIVTDLMGVRVKAVQTTAFVAGAVIAGIGGGLYGHHFSFVEAQHFSVALSVYTVLYVLLGGVQTLWGPLAGAAIFTLVPELLRVGQGYRYLFFGLFIIIFMAVRPYGLISPGVTNLFKKRWKDERQPQ